jgi:hypothetical protein
MLILPPEILLEAFSFLNSMDTLPEMVISSKETTPDKGEIILIH